MPRCSESVVRRFASVCEGAPPTVCEGDSVRVCVCEGDGACVCVCVCDGVRKSAKKRARALEEAEP